MGIVLKSTSAPSKRSLTMRESMATRVDILTCQLVPLISHVRKLRTYLVILRKGKHSAVLSPTSSWRTCSCALRVGTSCLEPLPPPIAWTARPSGADIVTRSWPESKGTGETRSTGTRPTADHTAQLRAKSRSALDLLPAGIARLAVGWDSGPQDTCRSAA